MSKFKIGDRVVVTVYGEDASCGQTGTVRQDAENPWVHFDSPTSYPDPVPEFRIPAGYADCPCEGHMELIDEEKSVPVNTDQSSSITHFALHLIESGLLDATACKVVASFTLGYTGEDDV